MPSFFLAVRRLRRRFRHVDRVNSQEKFLEFFLGHFFDGLEPNGHGPVVIDKKLLLTVRSIRRPFSQVTEYFSSKLRGSDTVCASAAVFLEPSAHHFDAS